MRIAGLVQDSIVDGPGLRFTVFTQGCPHGCAGCHNPETHDPMGGNEMEVTEVIQKMLSNPLTDGITLSGGEPFYQAADCAKIASAAHENGLNVWVYSGYTFEQLFTLAKQDHNIYTLLQETDILVDGRFVLEKRSLSTPWRGSTNQRIIDVKASIISGAAINAE